MKNVKYKGYTYNVSFEKYIHISILKARLLGRRIWRWKQLVHRIDLVLLFVLSLIWMLAGVLFSQIDKSELSLSLLALREEYISSVIIVGSIAWCNRIANYRKTNREQLWLYSCIMDSLNNMYDEYFGEMSLHYMPLFCDETIEQTKKLVVNQRVPIKDEKLRFMSEQALNQIRVLVEFNTMRRLNCCDYQMLDLAVAKCEGFLQGIIKDKRKYQKTYLEDLLIETSFLLDEVRKMWRCDNDLNCRIMDDLLVCGNSLLEDFYNRMYCYSFYEIKKYIWEQDLLNDITEEEYNSALGLMGIQLEDAIDFESCMELADKEGKDRLGRLF